MAICLNERSAFRIRRAPNSRCELGDRHMATIQQGIDAYTVFHMTENFAQSAIVHCHRGGVRKGSLFFYRDGDPIPASAVESSGVLSLRFHERYLPDVVATLRQEKP